jgi:mono/diheme cytochrome c family protein
LISLQHRKLRQRARALLGALFFFSAPAFAAEVSPKEAAAIFSQKCSGCHGDDGAGVHRPGVKLPDLRTPEWKQTHGDAKVRQIIADGVPGRHMPSFKNRLNPEQIAAVAALVRSFGK